MKYDIEYYLKGPDEKRITCGYIAEVYDKDRKLIHKTSVMGMEDVRREAIKVAESQRDFLSFTVKDVSN